MIEELTGLEVGIARFKASGKLTDADYQSFAPRLESLIEEYGKLSLFFELDDFHGWEPKAAWDDFMIGLTHPDDFERIAIVGDQAWQRWIALLAKPFTRAQVKYFNRQDRDAAWDWLKQTALSAARGERHTVASYQHVLIAIDFSSYALQVLERGLALAARDGAKVTLLNVVDEPLFSHEFEDPILPPVSERETRQLSHARTRLGRLVEAMGIEVESDAVSGRPKVEIPRYAEQHDIDLIVLGSHGTGGLATLLGSTADGVLQQAVCDVVVVRAPQKGAETKVR